MSRLVIFIFAIVMLASCTIYKEYPIDVYKPGEVSVPPDAKNVVLIYRNFKYPGDTLQNYYKDDYRLKQAKTNPVELDSTLVTACLNELAKNLKTQNAFENIKIMPYNSFKRHTANKLPALDFDVVKKIANVTNSDIIISLETFSYFFSEYSETYDRPKSNEVITANVWAVFDSNNEKMLERKALIDTLYWNGYDQNGNQIKDSQLPPRNAALKIASQMSGENYSKRFYASWETVKRMYSIPPVADFETASNYVSDGKWDKAMAIWKNYASDKNGKLAINARYNMALAYEMQDDLDMAYRWAASAQQLASAYRNKEDLKMIIQYEKVLAKRRADIAKLNEQN